MTAPDDRLALASEEDSATAADWERATAAVLRKSRRMREDDPDDLVWARLTRTTLDGIAVAPIGTPASLDGLTTAGRPSRAGAWDVRTPLSGSDASALNEAALVDLENGGTSLLLDVDDEVDLGAVLRGVLLDLAPVALDRPSAAQAAALADLLEAYDGPVAAGANLSFDPQSLELFSAADTEDGVEPAEQLVALARRAWQLGVLGLVVDGTALHDRGASDAQELGWTMAVGIHYLRVLAEAGMAVEEAARVIEFRYAATDEQFPTMAKLRAARRLWARVLEASGAGDVAMRQHAVTSRPMMTTFDPWVNMLRTTVAAFAAGAGGADVVTVVPFDEPLGRPDAFGRRIARNTSSLLIEESHLAVVADPAGGSYAVERLTDDLAVAGWAELGRIEEAGGAPSLAARQGVADRVSAAAAERDAQVADRSRPITGLSEFPNLAETLPAARAGRRARRPPGAPLRLGVRGAPRRARRRAGVPGHDGPDRGSHRPGHLRHQPARRGRRGRGGRRCDRRRRGRPGRVLRSAGRLPGRHRRGVRRVGRRRGRRAPRRRGVARRAGGQAGREDQHHRGHGGRLRRHGRRRAGVPDPDPGGTGMTIPSNFAGSTSPRPASGPRRPAPTARAG